MRLLVLAMMKERLMTLRNSRTLPGHSYCWSASTKSGSIFSTFFSSVSFNFSRKK